MTRGISYNVQIKKGASTLNRVIVAPPKFNSSGITIIADNNPGGSTINVDVTYFENGYDLNFKYSLNGTLYQTSPTFENMVGGDYTMYVKDQFECVIQKDFTLTSYGILSPYFLYSKSNSFRMANRIEFGDSSNYKNDENTLSCETEVPLPKMEIQRFQSGDIITTQFKTNYQNVSATAMTYNYGPGQVKIGQQVVQKTQNMGLNDSRDAVRFYTENLQLAIYFTSGNTYDFDTGSVTGNYTLNGALPEWGKAGNYVKINSTWFLIKDVFFVEEKNAECLILNTLFSPAEPGEEDEVVVGCIYNRFNYEVYEFQTDMADYLQYENIRIQIRVTDSNFETIEYLSEVINIKVRHENTVEILYWNKHNTDILYSTGIQHKIRIPINRVDGVLLGEHENHKTDSSVILVSAEVYEGDVYEFEGVTKELMRKIVQALHHSEVFMNGVKSVKESIELEGAIEETNLYILKATMVKAQNVYNSDSGINEFNDASIEIPALIGNGADFVKYQ